MRKIPVHDPRLRLTGPIKSITVQWIFGITREGGEYAASNAAPVDFYRYYYYYYTVPSVHAYRYIGCMSVCSVPGCTYIWGAPWPNVGRLFMDETGRFPRCLFLLSFTSSLRRTHSRNPGSIFLPSLRPSPSSCLMYCVILCRFLHNIPRLDPTILLVPVGSI